MRTYTMVPANPQAFYVTQTMASEELTLRELLAQCPALSLEPLDEIHLDVKVVHQLFEISDPPPGTPLYLPPGVRVDSVAWRGARIAAGDAADDGPDSGDRIPAARANGAASPATDVTDAAKAPDPEPESARASHPEKISERQAVLTAHDEDIAKAAAYLESGLSVLVSCDKLLVEHLAEAIARRSHRVPRVVRAASAAPGEEGPMGTASRRAELMTALQAEIAPAVETGDVVVVPHLDLMAGSTDGSLTREARDLTDVLYERTECILLGFTDPSLVIPEVLANRFAVRVPMEILHREVPGKFGPVPIGIALVTREEAELFAGFDADDLYKHIAGMNPVRLRNALRFAYHQHRPDASQARAATSPGPTFEALLEQLREFKAGTSSSFEVPKVTMAEIGGYENVKAELGRAIKIVRGAIDLPKKLQHDLVPRGFIFHGPPGTGKTLFAKAVANELGGTIQVVSGPEIVSKWVGESEHGIRELFAEARRNAPAVLVFDEFDSIAARRSGQSDGSARVGNGIVAQLLTELDGFRPEVPVLVIGTTNRIDIIDPALQRPSRFKAINIDLPDPQARRRIAEVHAGYFGFGPLSAELLDAIAQATNGMNGDEIRSIFRETKADELIEGPSDTSQAFQFGRRIGAIRLAQQERDADAADPGEAARRRARMQESASRSATGRANGQRDGHAPEEQPPRWRRTSGTGQVSGNETGGREA